MEPDASQRPGAPTPIGGPEDDQVQLLLDFLGTAPGPLRAWAEDRAREVRAATTSPGAAADPADLALAELGEQDDESRRRPRIHTPTDRPVTPAAASPRRGPGLLAPLLGVLLVAAVVYGVFRLGLPAETAATATQSATPQGPAARMAELEATLSADPDDVAANLELGVLTFNEGDVARAEQLWTRVTEVDPRNPQAWFNLGFVHLSQDPPDEAAARAVWEKVLEVAPESDLAATVRSHLAAFEAAAASPSPTSSGR